MLPPLKMPLMGLPLPPCCAYHAFAMALSPLRGAGFAIILPSFSSAASAYAGRLQECRYDYTPSCR